MSFLPVVQRELLVASRQGVTFWSRTLSAGVLLVFFVAAYIGFRSQRAMLGPRLLDFLSTIVFIECMLAGLRYTSDSLSEEKREGTLGLLFLTNLTGLDVVLGKMMARSLRAVYGLVAVIPILALPMMIGGVAFGQFAALASVLLVSTIFSLCAGSFVSSRGIREKSVLLQTLAVLFLCAVVLHFVAEFGSSGFFWLSAIGYLSPVRTFIAAGRGGVPDVKVGCAVMLLASGAALIYSGWRIRREYSAASNLSAEPAVRRSRARAEDRHERWARTLNPFLWLAMRSRSSKTNVWLLGSFFIFFGVFCRIVVESKWRIGIPLVIFGSYGVHVLLKFLVAAEGCRQMNEDRRGGALELLLVTPGALDSLVSSQFRASTKVWLPAAFCLCLMNLIWMTEATFVRDLGILLPVSVLFVFLDGYTLVWRGILHGVKGERYPRTVFRTVFEVLGPPLVMLIFSYFILMATGGQQGTVNTLIVCWTIIAAILDLVLAANARIKLANLRALASGESEIPAISAPSKVLTLRRTLAMSKT